MKNILIIMFGILLLTSFVIAKTDSEKLDDITIKLDKLDKMDEYLGDIHAQTHKGSIEVHGTEYMPGDRAKVWLQLIDGDGDYVDDALCYTDIYTPTGSELIENALMTNMQHDGIYYYDLVAPQSNGVYPAIAKCFFEATSTLFNATSSDINEGSTTSGSYLSTLIKDGTVWTIYESPSDKVFDIDINDTGFCPGYNESTLTGVSIYYYGRWNSVIPNDNVLISFYNHTSGTYQQLPNEIISAIPTFQTETNSLSGNNTTKLGFTDFDGGEVSIKFQSTATGGGSRDTFDIDHFYVSCDELTEPTWQELKGSSELHITSDDDFTILVTSGEIKGDVFPDFFYYNFTIGSSTSQLELDEKVHITMPRPFPCHHINQLFIEGVEYNFTMSNADNDALSRGCKVSWEMDLNDSTNYEAQIVADNWFKEIEVLWLTEMQLQHRAIWVACENYRLDQNFSEYVVPRPNSSNPFNELQDELYDVCYAYLDVYHHYNQSYFYEYYTPAGTFTNEDMLFLDNMYGHMIEGRDELNIIAMTILTTLSTIGDYSLTIISDPNNLTETNWSRRYAEISTSYLNYLATSSITSGAVNVSVDNDAIANSVWNYAGSIDTGILGQIAQAIWDYVSRYTHGVELN